MNRNLAWVAFIIFILVVVGSLIFFKSLDNPSVLDKTVKSEPAVLLPTSQENKDKAFPEVDNIEKDAVKKDTVNAPVSVAKNLDIKEQPSVLKKSAEKTTEIYKTSYFAIEYPTKDWEPAEGKSMDLPSYVNVPQNVALAMVQILNKHNENSIFLHVSSSNKADFNKMTNPEIVDYIQSIYSDKRIKNIPISNINNNKFALLEFTPRNNSKVSVRQYLTTKDNNLYDIIFIENKSEPISEKMVDNILNSINPKDDSLQKEPKTENKQMVGGWYPVFFNKYDQKQVDAIIDSIKNGRVKRITITYDNNKSLAEQVKAGIQKELNFAVMMDHVQNKDTDTVQYDHDKVVVTVYQ